MLVDGDLRRSKVASTIGVSNSAGLSDVLAGRAEVTDLLQRAPQSPNLWVMAAGSAPPNPSEVLGSARMKALLEQLAAHATVIVDAPPLIPVTDGAVLAHQADGAIVVVSVGKTTYDLVAKALDTLQKARGRALGVVLNKVPLKGADAATYSYGYRRHYDEKPTRKKTKNASKSERVGTLPPTSAADIASITDRSPSSPGVARQSSAFDTGAVAEGMADSANGFVDLFDDDTRDAETTGKSRRRNRAS